MKIHRNHLKDYWDFLVEEVYALFFGVNFTFLSSFGQTFLLSLFVPHFINVFDLTKASFGTIYSLLTLTSAAIIPVVGGWIDHTPLKFYSLFVMLGLVVGALITAFSWHLILLIPGLFFLRLCGQGLSTHTAKTSIGRFYEQERGKALSIINLGLPVGEGILPLLIAGLISGFSWRWTLIAIAFVVALIVLPIQLFLLERSSLSYLSDQTTDKSFKNNKKNHFLNFRRFKVYFSIMGELRFWLITPAVILPPFWITGLFLYQTSLADQFGWSVQLLATAFVAYAVVRVVFSLGIGPAIDRLSARFLFPFYLLPFGAALIFAYFHPGHWSAFAYMSMLGVTMGAGSSIKTALWAELYSLEILGRVRSLFSSIMVFSTSVSPILLGWLLDAGYPFRNILLWALLSIVFAIIGAGLGARKMG